MNTWQWDEVFETFRNSFLVKKWHFRFGKTQDLEKWGAPTVHFWRVNMKNFKMAWTQKHPRRHFLHRMVPVDPPIWSHSVKMQSEKWGWRSHFVVNHGFLDGFSWLYHFMLRIWSFFGTTTNHFVTEKKSFCRRFWLYFQYMYNFVDVLVVIATVCSNCTEERLAPRSHVSGHESLHVCVSVCVCVGYDAKIE